MSFTVCMKKRKRMTFVRVLCIVMILVIGFFMNLGPMREYLIEDSSYLIFMVLMAVFVLMFAYTFYVQRRPRIEVDGQDIAFYPLWAPAKKVTLSEITARRERPEFYDPRQAAAGAMGGARLCGCPEERPDDTDAQGDGLYLLPRPVQADHHYHPGDGERRAV